MNIERLYNLESMFRQFDLYFNYSLKFDNRKIYFNYSISNLYKERKISLVFCRFDIKELSREIKGLEFMNKDDIFIDD